MRGAAEVAFRLGVAEVSIERVRAASGASRSHVYRYFPANAISLAIDRLVPARASTSVAASTTAP
jgi:AcrR family transcriptional regulator